jgi:DNA-binding MarR family transcriptional regulator
VRPKDRARPKHREVDINEQSRERAVEDVIAGYEVLMQRLADTHAPEFLEIDVTMPQAKLVYLLAAAGELHMSELVTALGVSLSTVSGLVDRVVDHGLATRREDAADRRQVVVAITPKGAEFIDRFRDLNARQMRELLAHLDDRELDVVRGALDALSRAAAARSRSPQPAPRSRSGSASAARKDPA